MRASWVDESVATVEREIGNFCSSDNVTSTDMSITRKAAPETQRVVCT